MAGRLEPPEPPFSSLKGEKTSKKTTICWTRTFRAQQSAAAYVRKRRAPWLDGNRLVSSGVVQERAQAANESNIVRARGRELSLRLTGSRWAARRRPYMHLAASSRRLSGAAKSHGVPLTCGRRAASRDEVLPFTKTEIETIRIETHLHDREHGRRSQRYAAPRFGRTRQTVERNSKWTRRYDWGCALVVTIKRLGSIEEAARFLGVLTDLVRARAKANAHYRAELVGALTTFRMQRRARAARKAAAAARRLSLVAIEEPGNQLEPANVLAVELTEGDPLEAA